MAITRNTITKDPAQRASVIKKTDAFESTRRSMKLAKAESEYEKTGDFKTLDTTAAKVQEKTLGGSVEQFNVEQKRDSLEDKDFSRQVKQAQIAYENTPGQESADALKSVMEKGFQRYSDQSSTGMDIGQAIRGVETTEMSRALYDLESDWQNDPALYKDQYKEELEKQISYYGEDSVNGVKLSQKVRMVEEESLLGDVRNAMLDYDKDPVGSYDKLIDTQKKLADFYGSSEDGYYARVTLNNIGSAEQERLDTQASTDFETGKVGYDGYLSYLNASMSKYEEGSEEYMKYYKASSELKFNKNMDELIRLQYEKPTGQVQSALVDFQKQFEPGSVAYNQIQDQVDTLEEQIRYNAYQEMVKDEIRERQEEINSLEVKLYTLEQDYLNGEISESKYKSKYQKYSNKIDYLGDQNTLPQFEIWKTYK